MKKEAILLAFSKSVTFHPNQATIGRRVWPSCALREMQQIADDDFSQYGGDYESLLANDCVFVLMRQALHFKKPFSHSQKMTLSTWPAGTRGASFLRNYRWLCDEEVVAESTTEWALLAPQSRRIRRPSELPFPIPNVDKTVEVRTQKKLFAPEGNAPDKKSPADEKYLIGERIVRFSDLDCNIHLNNVIYCDIVLDHCPLDLNTRFVQELYIDYIAEAHLGDKLLIYGVTEGETFSVRGWNETRGGTCFEAKICFAEA